MEQTATICGGQVWKALFKGAPSSLDKKVKRMGGRGKRRKIQICEFARRVTAPSALRPAPLAPMLVVVSRENITTMAAASAAHKFVTAVLQMASSIFPARPFLPSSSARRASSSIAERDGSEARPCRFGGEGQKLALQGISEFEIASIL